METLTANRVDRNTRQDKSKPKWIVTAPYRYRFGDWTEIHAMTLQGWFFIRRGSELIGHYGDLEEGRA